MARVEENMQEEEIKKLKTRAYQDIIYNFLYLMDDGKRITDYLRYHNCERVIIYGGNRLGRFVKDSLDKCPDIQVVAMMDQAADRWKAGFWGIPAVKPDALAAMMDVDMVIVIPVFYYEDILKNLTRICPDIPVVSLNTIIMRLCDEVYYEKR